MSTRPLSARVAAPAIWLIRAYQMVISPMRPPTCRFYPSCSAYALTAIERFGLLRGTWLAGRRLLRCHPWSPGGVDHVPQRNPERLPNLSPGDHLPGDHLPGDHSANVEHMSDFPTRQT